MLKGSSDSPMWKRGWRDFSSSTTSRPRMASSAAIVEPAGPPPITSTSQWSASTGEIVVKEKRSNYTWRDRAERVPREPDCWSREVTVQEQVDEPDRAGRNGRFSQGLGAIQSFRRRLRPGGDRHHGSAERRNIRADRIRHDHAKIHRQAK